MAKQCACQRWVIMIRDASGYCSLLPRQSPFAAAALLAAAVLYIGSLSLHTTTDPYAQSPNDYFNEILNDFLVASSRK